MGGVKQDLKKLHRNHDEARGHQETTTFFSRLRLAKNALEDFVLGLKVNVNIFARENLINFILK